MLLNAKGAEGDHDPAELRARIRLRESDKVDVVEVDGALTIARAERAERAESRGWRAVRRLRGGATDSETAGMTTDELMELLCGE
jgi:hypothetical protein